jgi:GGDEF domain-containing protein
MDLRETLATLESLLRGYDLLSRYSDRLVVVGLPETDAAETRRIAARLLRALEESKQVAVRRLSYSLMPDDGASLSILLERAEDRLSA